MLGLDHLAQYREHNKTFPHSTPFLLAQVKSFHSSLDSGLEATTPLSFAAYDLTATWA